MGEDDDLPRGAFVAVNRRIDLAEHDRREVEIGYRHLELSWQRREQDFFRPVRKCLDFVREVRIDGNMNVGCIEHSAVRHMNVMGCESPRVADDHRMRMDHAGRLALRLYPKRADMTVEGDQAGASFEKPADQSPSKKKNDLFADARE